MPVKRRSKKGRLRAGWTELQAWREVFCYGSDLIGLLTWVAGVPLDKDLRPDRAVAEEAWHRIGHLYRHEPTPDQPLPWAFLEFGEPKGA